ncbi:MAG: hypothetical protein WC466_03825 [Candidatus Izemoplasmatales bacterium]
MKKILKDILKAKEGEGVKYSQGRVYLFVSFISYILYVSFLAVQIIRCGNSFDTENAEIIISSLQWIMGLLAGYVFGAKGIEALKTVISSKNEAQKNKDAEKTNEDSTVIP